jgi:hypothetical protein
MTVRARTPNADAGETPSLADFVAAHVRTRTGRYSFVGRGPLLGICDALGNPAIPRVDILKATQIGMTTLAGFGQSLWETGVFGRNVGYFLPTERMAREVLGERLRHALDEGSSLDIGVTSSEGIARFGEGRIYVRGLTTIHSALSVPLDINLYDEVDDLNPDHFLWARQRLDASPYAREIAFACGRFPAEGMDARFQCGTQHHWHVRCPACGYADTVPELAFPDCVARKNGVHTLVCTRCDADLDVGNGQWVAHYPKRHTTSFRVSALSVPALSLDRIMSEWEAALREHRLMAPFRCSKLALPDAAERQALSAEDLANACESADRVPVPPLFVGVDTGDWCHLAAAESVDNAIVYRVFDRVPGEALVERLAALNARHSLAGILIDQRPEGSLARAVCRQFPRIACLQQFGATERDRAKKLAGEVFRAMSFDREDTLGAWCDHVRMAPPRVRFPHTVNGVPFLESEPARQILTGAQRTETFHNGMTARRFRGGRAENHYFMACVFAWRICAHERGGRVPANGIRLVGSTATQELRGPGARA